MQKILHKTLRVIYQSDKCYKNLLNLDKDTERFWLLKFYTAHKMKFSTKDFFSKCDQIHIFLDSI